MKIYKDEEGWVALMERLHDGKGDWTTARVTRRTPKAEVTTPITKSWVDEVRGQDELTHRLN